MTAVVLALGALTAAGPASAGVRLVGIQLHLPIAVYRDLGTFQRYIEAATVDALKKERLRPGETPVLVFPEHVGTFLSFCGQREEFYAAPTMTRAMFFCFLSNPGLYWRHITTSLRVGRWDILDDFLGFGNFLRGRARWTWKAYLDSFSDLARRHRAVVVAGSISIPRPEEFHRLYAPLYGTSAVFGPGGELLGVVRKLHPVSKETLFMTPAPPTELRPIETPAGRVGVLICSDSWFPDAYELLRDSDFLAIPGIGEDGLQAFAKAMAAFQSGGAPAAGGAIWDRFFSDGVASRMRLTRARAAVMPFLTGPVIDLQSGGPGLAVVRRGERLDVRVVPTMAGRSTFLSATLPPRRR